MWAVYALLSAVLAGTNAVLSKYGSDRTGATVATAVRTTAVLTVSVLVIAIVGGEASLASIEPRAVIVSALSAVATAGAWVCYFRALSAGSVERVSAVDKFSVVLTLLGGSLFLGESLNAHKMIAIFLISVGIWCSAEKKSNEIDKTSVGSMSWLMWALLSTALVSASALLSKAGVDKIAPETVLFVRTGFVLLLVWTAVVAKKEMPQVRRMGGKTALVLLISGVLTGLGWWCYFRALREGGAGEVHAIDKLSIVVTAVLSRIVFREKSSGRYLCGLVLIVAGILWLYFTSDRRII
ncbi:MAG: EamA family transporter [Clostridia bacterium]|nr:EamA family transporter [Clostridia bacterium]